MCDYVDAGPSCRLFEMGFADQLQEIIRRLPETRQTLLFSATLPKLLVEFARAGETHSHLLYKRHNGLKARTSTIIQIFFFYISRPD